MPHARAGAAQRCVRIVQIRAVRELQVHVLPVDDDHADAILEDAIGRAVEQHDRVPHRVEELVARRALLDHDRSKSDGQRANVRIVAAEELEQLARRLRHRALERRSAGPSRYGCTARSS
jgi:hypothetical protein